MKDKIDIWNFQSNLSKRLLIWGAGSTLIGLALFVFTDGFWGGFGLQALVWGVIDGLIAGFGLWSSRKRQESADPNDAKLRDRESGKLRRTLLINAALDVLYLSGGIILAATLGRSNPGWRGHGWGIIVQGAFLLFFDLIQGQSVPPGSLSPPLRAFTDPAHQPFFLPGGGGGAALLVHGFPGTPAEMRPLAESLNKQGWTVQGILLPGFGSQFSEILERGYPDWLEAVERALQALKQKYSPLLLIGYSLGGALSLRAAAEVQPDGLVLLSPFWRLGTPLQRLIGSLLRPFLPRYFRPLRKADLDDPKLRRSLGEFFPDVDFSDPEARNWLRDLQVPISVIGQIMKTGKQGFRSARSVAVPTLVVQGKADELVKPENTRNLIDRLSSLPRYLEVAGGHSIIDKGQPGWARLEQALIEFSRSITDGERIRA